MRKMDEMELKISGKAIKITWFVTVLVLFIVGFIQKYKSGGGNVFLVIATSSVVLNMALERYYLARVNGDRSIIRFIAPTAIFLAIVLFMGWWLGN